MTMVISTGTSPMERRTYRPSSRQEPYRIRPPPTLRAASPPASGFRIAPHSSPRRRRRWRAGRRGSEPGTLTVSDGKGQRRWRVSPCGGDENPASGGASWGGASPVCPYRACIFASIPSLARYFHDMRPVVAPIGCRVLAEFKRRCVAPQCTFCSVRFPPLVACLEQFQLFHVFLLS